MRAREIRVRGLDEVEQLSDLDPARQDGDVGDEADVLHQFLALPERIQAEHGQFAVAVGQPQESFQ